MIRRAHSGFTLIELMVAIAIFSFLAAAMYTGIRQFTIEREILLEQAASLQALQRAVRYLNTDFSQIHPRSVRDALGQDRLPPLVTDASETFALELTRDGWRNPALAPRGTLQRVQYRLEDGELIREYWPVMDRLLGDEPRSLTLLDNMQSVEFGYLDSRNEWQPDWPPTNIGPDEDAGLPRAIKYRLEIENFGPIERLVEVPW